MTLRERDAIERAVGNFVPSFMERFHATDGTCTACLCPCAEHWEPLAVGDGWRGCTYALKQEVTRLRAEVAAKA